MGIFSRMGDIINSNLNAMIDKAENPEKIARLIIQEMEDTLVEVRTDAARNIAERKELSRKAAAKQQAEQMSDVVLKEIDILDEAVAKADGDLSKLQTKLDEAKAKHKALMMRTTVATGQIRMRTVLNDNKVDDALARYERMERKVDELEAHVEAFDLGSGESLESQFAALEAAELDQMSKIADILDQRVNVLERILDDEVPNWRENNDKTI